MHRLARITCDTHMAYALAEHHLPDRFELGTDSPCRDCRDALYRINGTALAFSHLDFGRRALLNAVHEAGHAVTHLVFGHTVNYAMVSANPDANGVIGEVNFDAYDTAANVAGTTWAGQCAVIEQLDWWGALDDASRLDAAYAVRGDWAVLAGLGLNDSRLRACRDQAADMVAEYWGAIERVADALLRTGRLPGDEVAMIAGIGVDA